MIRKLEGGLVWELAWDKCSLREDRDSFLAFEDGALDKRTLEITPFSETLGIRVDAVVKTSFTKGVAELRETGKYPPKFETYVETLCADFDHEHRTDNINILRGILRRSLCPRPYYQTGLFLTGPPAGGKSTLTTLISEILGPRCVNTTLKQLANNFEREKFREAWVVIISETETKFFEAAKSTIKSLLGRDPIPFEVKNVQSTALGKRSDFVFGGIVIIVSNKDLQDLMPPDSALYTRFLRLAFKSTVDTGRSTLDLRRLLVKLAPLFTDWALTAEESVFRDHVRSGNRGFSYMSQESVLVDFLASKMYFGTREEGSGLKPNLGVSRLTVQALFKDFCKDQGFTVSHYSQADLVTIAENVFGIKLVKSRPLKKGKRIQYWEGCVNGERAIYPTK